MSLELQNVSTQSEDTGVLLSWDKTGPPVCVTEWVLRCIPPQSLNKAHLRVLGRDHGPQQALQTLAEARTLCPGCVSVDVMFGIPGQSVASWESELEEVLSVCDDHVSLYQLTLERGTHLYKQVRQGELSMPTDDVTASMYRSARNILEQAGLLQYEVSNFARNVRFFFCIF